MTRLTHLISVLAVIIIFTSCSEQNKEVKIPEGTLDDQLAYIENEANFKNESQRVNLLFEIYTQSILASSPMTATYYGKEGYNHLWDDLSQKGTTEKLKNLKLFNASTAWFRNNQFDKIDDINFQLFVKDLESKTGLYGNYQEQYFLIDQIQGMHNAIAAVIQIMPTNNQKDIDDLLARLRSIPELLEGAKGTLSEGIEKGIVMPTNTVINVPNQLEIMISERISESLFFKPFSSLEKEINPEGNPSFQDEARKIIEEVVNPSLRDFQQFIKEEYLPKTRSTYGMSELPNGNNWYKERIRYHTTTNLTAKEIHELGKSEVARILNEMQDILVELNFQGDLDDFNTFLKEDPQFYYETAEELLVAYRDICKRIDPMLPSLFGKLPKLPYGVIPVPSYAEKSTTTAYYQSGSQSTGVPGYFYANTYNLKSRPSWEMEALSIHEAVPGHHLQITLAQEMGDVPEFRSMLDFTAFVEGWGLYSESLGPELGMYKTPYSKYGQLTYEMWRAIRLVVDTGIHAFGWSRADAIAFFKKHSGKSEHDIEVEIDRYIAWPGQALAYKIGELKIKELKLKSKETLGDSFDIRSFHDVVLGSGAIPLDMLEENVNSWIADQLESK
ncbi:MAG: DUF885 domain-containing protein [Reichenbachiella sp.]